jgi:hypothetical protein
VDSIVDMNPLNPNMGCMFTCNENPSSGSRDNNSSRCIQIRLYIETFPSDRLEGSLDAKSMNRSISNRCTNWEKET